MELDIKHLAAYLPYGLKILYYNGNATPYIKELVSLNTKLLSGRILGNEKHKPILYPLDYLTKEITHNGEKFVPVNKLFEHYEDVKITKFESNQTTITATYKIVEEGDVFTEFIVFQNTIVDVRYWIVETLLEWKLDIFNLIENKLAIPVTEDFNPYK